ncbi:MAG: hypothetical protein MN733_18465, partial [Nitrososphaera sp.]|nr:hypothetical protein [Nitrososphaera sp.]
MELKEFLNGLRRDLLSEELVQEILATIEGAKGLLRPKEREVPDDENSKAAHVIQLEEEINRFDRDQTEGYLVRTTGVQRIRGLAGSGKTIVLAIKAALLHLQHPDAKIAFTFHTKSLYQHVRRLITRFYRQYDDRDPDWDRLHVLHGWGGKSNQGIYYNACVNNGAHPLTFSEANAMGGRSALDSACSSLLAELIPRPEYDHVLVDEAQDFPPSFLRLCYALARNGNLVYAYDQLQTIFQVKPPSVDEVFGLNEQGEPNVQLASDVVLHRCYRNPMEVTVCAHALGFGIYGDRIVQMLENEDHWKDLGYRVLNPPFKAGALTEIERVQDSSPSSISRNYRPDEIVSVAVYADATEEIAAVVTQIDKAIRSQGLRPDDILVISCDD